MVVLIWLFVDVVYMNPLVWPTDEVSIPSPASYMNHAYVLPNEHSEISGLTLSPS